MVDTVSKLKLLFLCCLFSPVFCWAELDYMSLYDHVSRGKAILIDARQGIRPGELSVKGSRWVEWPATTQELPRVFDKLSRCLKIKKVYVFCYVGSWAGFVTEELNKRGIQTLNTGGYSDWELADVPMGQLEVVDNLMQCY